MKNIKNITALLAFSLIIFSSINASARSITLGWAAWDPANALVELSKDFTKETGIEMKYEFVPWPNFADRMLNELNSGGKTFDVLIGVSVTSIEPCASRKKMAEASGLSRKSYTTRCTVSPAQYSSIFSI